MSEEHPISDDTRERITTPTAGATSLTVPFYFQANADIAVSREVTAGAGDFLDLTEGVHYSLTGANVNSGGTVTLVTAADGTHQYRVQGRASLTRATSVVQGGSQRGLLVDRELDRTRIIEQELRRDLHSSGGDSSALALIAAEAATRAAADEALALLIGSGGEGGAPFTDIYASRAALALSFVPEAVDQLRTLGYYQPGIGGGVYVRSETEPSRPGWVQSVDGAYWDLVNGESPEQFGAYGDWDVLAGTGHDDTQAWNDLFTYGRGRQTLNLSAEDLGYGFYGFTRWSVRCRIGAIYKISAPIDATGFLNYGLNVFGMGALIYPIFTAQKPVIDGTNSLNVWLHELLIFSDDPVLLGSVAPSYGIVQGRCSDQDASGWRLTNVDVQGWYKYACFLNISGEIALHDHCTYHNYWESVPYNEDGDFWEGLAYCYSDHEIPTFTSEFVEYEARSQYFGTGNNRFHHCHFQNELGIPVVLADRTSGWAFEQCYGYTENTQAPIVYLSGDYHNGLRIEMHGEGAPACLVMFNNVPVAMELRGLVVNEEYLGDSGALLGAYDAAAGEVVVLYEANLRIGATHRPEDGPATRRIALGDDWIQFSGEIHVSEGDASLCNLTAFNLYLGSFHNAKKSSTDLTNKPVGGWIEFRGLDFATL